MGPVLAYFDELTAAMNMLAKQPKSMFIGQGVGCAGTTMTDTLKDIPPDQLLEFPVAEDLQMGFCTGMSLNGWLPICIFPRWNFLICAANQIVNHLDALPLFSEYRPKVIIRTAVPITHPFNPGPQHDGDFTDAFWELLRTVDLICLRRPENIMPAYQQALGSPHSTILVEYTGLYKMVPSGVKDDERVNA